MLKACPIAAALLACALSACSSQQMYASGQAWQRSQCDRVVDYQERQRCMARTNTSYEEYKRESEPDR